MTAGGILFFPPGTYKTTTKIDLPASVFARIRVGHSMP
jgi:hypothetical protein